MNSATLSRVAVPDASTDADVILETTSVPRYYWALALPSGATMGRRILLATNQAEPMPVVHDDGEGPILLGAEQGAFSIDRHTGQVLEKITDLTDVVLVKVVSTGDVVVQAGDQLVAFDQKGSARWRQTFPDLVDEISEGPDQTLLVATLDGERYQVDLRSGRASRSR